MSKGFKWEANKAVGKAKEAAERELGKTGRVLLRPSGTEPVLRVMVEATDRPTADACAERVANSKPTLLMPSTRWAVSSGPSWR